ncbi:dermonecrotic toxin domain-containing protein [Pseudomonas plecoglossicida]|uniref:dermonecrotic toxin domain-containing protein n=1 Tax=Pseudomonas plecoglossicida TaxID=70775 RepID=UPI003977D7E5
MTPLERLEALDSRIAALQNGYPQLNRELPLDQRRPQMHGDLADFWTDSAAQRNKAALVALRREQLLAEIELRLGDQTLSDAHIHLLRTCLELPQYWQRQHLPQALRPQVYRVMFSTLRPNRRVHLPGAVVILAGGPEGIDPTPGTTQGSALLCSLAHGVEAFDDLRSLHVELCERLDDPKQSQPLLNLLQREQDRAVIRQADRLRYAWYADDLVTEQVQDLIDIQRAQLLAAWQNGNPTDLDAFETQLKTAMDLLPLMGSEWALATRYSLLLEKHLPAWLRQASPQGLAYIMQTMQALAGALEQAVAPGILTLEQFNQRNTLLGWVRNRLTEKLRRLAGKQKVPALHDIRISVTMARKIGPLFNPLSPSSYIAAASRPQVGSTIEMVTTTYRLDELALLNVAWLDVDYWLTARVQQPEQDAIEELTPKRVKAMVRELDAGASYIRYLRTHLLESAEAQWRQEMHGRINATRMHAELAKARHAGHLLPSPVQQGYRWAKAIIQYPDSNWRPTIEEHRISVRQLIILGHTVQGVLLINAEVDAVTSVVIYTPDAPDRRPWREFRTTRDLLRFLRGSAAIRQYVAQRVPLADASKVDALLRKGRLGTHTRRPTIDGNLFEACYRAQVRSLMAQADASSRDNTELLGQMALNGLRLLLDLLNFVLPAPAMWPLALGRAAISVWDYFEALERKDRDTMLHHFCAAISHSFDARNSFAGSTSLRRALRGLPPQPPLPLPPVQAVEVDPAKLRYRIDGVHGEGVYEKTGANPGLSQYYIRDAQGRFYHVNFDGHRWRATDPRQPDAYIKLPLKLLQNGTWVVDSPALWHDGLPDLTQLFDDCRLNPAVPGSAIADEQGLHDHDGQLYLQLAGRQLPVRRHLLANHYHLTIANAQRSAVHAWAVLRRQDGQWQVRVRQPGRSSDWLALPPGYSESLGNSLSNR